VSGLKGAWIQIQTHGLMKQDARAMMVVGMTGMSWTRFRHADEAGEATDCQLPMVLFGKHVLQNLCFPYLSKRGQRLGVIGGKSTCI
jgi:hypothetical protein